MTPFTGLLFKPLLHFAYVKFSMPASLKFPLFLISAPKEASMTPLTCLFFKQLVHFSCSKCSMTAGLKFPLFLIVTPKKALHVHVLQTVGALLGDFKFSMPASLKFPLLLISIPKKASMKASRRRTWNPPPSPKRCAPARTSRGASPTWQ